MKQYWVYILASHSKRLYVGMTNDLTRRVREHRAGDAPGFTMQYRIDQLVYYEEYREVHDAIAREKQLKTWRREKKRALIEARNPDWVDLSLG